MMNGMMKTDQNDDNAADACEREHNQYHLGDRRHNYHGGAEYEDNGGRRHHRVVLCGR